MDTIKPANGVNWSLEELQTLVGGYIEAVRIGPSKWLIVDEEGLLKNKPFNANASTMASCQIVGDAVMVGTWMEMNGPEDEQ
jgi:sarcosine oxidase gamma subunit